MLRSMWRALALLCLVLTLSGCRKEDPNPELLDLVYMDLSRRAGDAQKSYEDELVKLKDARAALEKLEPMSPELRNARRDVAKSTLAARELEQTAHFYQIRSKRRLLVDRITYKAAFAKNLPWPDPHEYSDYQVNMRLREAKSNWSTRVPKLTDRLPSSTGAGKEGKKEEKKAEE